VVGVLVNLEELKHALSHRLPSGGPPARRLSWINVSDPTVAADLDLAAP
jgi:hypothetical protein